jgi:hypothetical protein
VGAAAIVGLIVVLLALAGFTLVTTISATSAVHGVSAAFQVDEAFQDVRHAADIEAGFQDAYWRESHADVRLQFAQAAQALDSALQRVAKIAPSSPDGGADDTASIDSLRNLQTRERAAFTQLADAIDAGNRDRANAVDLGVLDPLHQAMTREIATAIAHNRVETDQTLDTT